MGPRNEYELHFARRQKRESRAAAFFFFFYFSDLQLRRQLAPASYESFFSPIE